MSALQAELTEKMARRMFEIEWAATPDSKIALDVDTRDQNWPVWRDRYIMLAKAARAAIADAHYAVVPVAPSHDMREAVREIGGIQWVANANAVYPTMIKVGDLAADCD